MSTSAKTVEVRIFAVVEKRSGVFERLTASLRNLVFRAESQPKDQSYADYLETMARLTGF
ncbi:MAG TPA: hypothetical protein VIB39_21605 [Candidatus Angelobacter sp.]